MCLGKEYVVGYLTLGHCVGAGFPLDGCGGWWGNWLAIWQDLSGPENSLVLESVHFHSGLLMEASLKVKSSLTFFQSLSHFPEYLVYPFIDMLGVTQDLLPIQNQIP